MRSIRRLEAGFDSRSVQKFTCADDGRGRILDWGLYPNYWSKWQSGSVPSENDPAVTDWRPTDSKTGGGDGLAALDLQNLKA